MSKALDMADLIRTRLLTAPTEGELETPQNITAVPVIVDRQKNIVSAVTLAVSKTSGCAITILWEGFTTADENSRKPRLAHRYTVSVFAKPVISGDELTADDVMESVILRLWHWRPGGGHAFGEAVVRNGGLLPHKSFLIYDCEVVIPSTH